MYAVFQTGGKQYRVQPGDILAIEKLEGEVGSSIRFDQVLFASKANAESPQVWLGKPLLGGASVEGEIVGQGRGEKILIIKMKRRKQYRRTQGHRQPLTQILVTSVDSGAGEKATLAAEEKKAKLDKFVSLLKPRGEAFHAPKSLQPSFRSENFQKDSAKKAPAAETAAPKKAKASDSEEAPAKKKTAGKASGTKSAKSKSPAKKK